jgi:hypothetical protein
VDTTHPLLNEVIEHVVRAAVLPVLFLDLLVLSRREVVGCRVRIAEHNLSGGSGLACPRSAAHTARLDLEVSAGWTSPSSRGPWGSDALLPHPVENRNPTASSFPVFVRSALDPKPKGAVLGLCAGFACACRCHRPVAHRLGEVDSRARAPRLVLLPQRVVELRHAAVPVAQCVALRSHVLASVRSLPRHAAAERQRSSVPWPILPN